MKKLYTDEELEEFKHKTSIKKKEILDNLSSIVDENGIPFFNKEYLNKMLKINKKDNENNEKLR